MLFLALRSVVSSRPVPLASCRHPVLQDTTKPKLPAELPAGAVENRQYTHAMVVRQTKEGLQAMLHPHVQGENCVSLPLSTTSKCKVNCQLNTSNA